MRRLVTVVLFCVCGALATSSGVLSASADNTTSMGSMTAMPKSHQYLLGVWQCTVHLAAMGGEPATTDHGTLTISMAPGNTIHWHVGASDYMSSSYEGYDVRSKTHWLNTVDTTGVVTAETSKDGMVYTGTSLEGGKSTPTRDTQTKISDTEIRDITEIQVKSFEMEASRKIVFPGSTGFFFAKSE